MTGRRNHLISRRQSAAQSSEAEAADKRLFALGRELLREPHPIGIIRKARNVRQMRNEPGVDMVLTEDDDDGDDSSRALI